MNEAMQMPQNGYNHDCLRLLPVKGEKWINFVTNAYKEPQRHYHTLDHVNSMLTHLDSIKGRLHLSHKQLDILHLAIWFHDVIYDPQTKRPGYNEIQSAFVFENYARDIDLDADVSESVKYLILCTIKHTLQPILPSTSEYAGDNDILTLFRELPTTPPAILENSDLTASFLDLDLSILGAMEEEYDAYAQQIREEYCHFSWEDYSKGRRAVMEGFLKRERLYFTPHFYNKYESVARNNIQSEIDSLQNTQESVE